jgi:hypothetical protein
MAIATKTIAPLIINIATDIVLLQRTLMVGAIALQIHRDKYRKAPDNFRKGGDRFNLRQERYRHHTDILRKSGINYHNFLDPTVRTLPLHLLR